MTDLSVINVSDVVHFVNSPSALYVWGECPVPQAVGLAYEVDIWMARRRAFEQPLMFASQVLVEEPSDTAPREEGCR